MSVCIIRLLPNSATYFLTFANVSKDDCNDYQKKFGSSLDCKWKPLNYEKRLSDAEVFTKKWKSRKVPWPKLPHKIKLQLLLVQNLKAVKNLSHSLTPFLIGQKQNRLKNNLKNNTIKEQFMKLLKISMAMTRMERRKVSMMFAKIAISLSLLNLSIAKWDLTCYQSELRLGLMRIMVLNVTFHFDLEAKKVFFS